MTTRRAFFTSVPAAGATLMLAGGGGLLPLPAQAQQAPAAPGGLSLVQQRAVQAMIWAMPAVNLDLMYQAMLRETAGRANQMLYWADLLDWHNQTLTPNPDVIYLTPYFDTREAGPMVIEIPPAEGGVINGTIMDAWQMPLEDVGPAGVDGGKGGKYLILPPGYAEPWPEGYIVLPSETWSGYALLRSILNSGSAADVAKAVDYGRRIAVYPLSAAANPPPTVFTDAAGVLYDATIPYDSRFFDALDRMVQREPWLQRDRAMIDILRSIGIEKGKAFAPDDAMRKDLDAAAAAAHQVLDGWYIDTFKTPFAKGSNWAFPARLDFVEAVQSHYADPNLYPIDARGVLFTYIFFTPKRLGEGQFYLMTLDDSSGAALDGGKNYRLTVPADAPVRQYWSATVYDRDTHALIRNMPHAGRSSQSPGLQVNDDGSVAIYFGPKPPEGQETNWVPTDPAAGFEVMFRFYAPTAALFDQTWVLPAVDAV